MPDLHDDRRLLERPGRLAAVGAAIAVCAVSLSGAFGISFSGAQAGPARPQAMNKPSDVTPVVGSTRSPVAEEKHANGASAAGGHSLGVRHHASVETPVDVSLPHRSGTGKRVVFDMSRQRVWLVGPAGKVLRNYPVSGSKYDNLRPGTYSVSSKSRRATAYNSNETLPFMVRFAYGTRAPIGFHAIPVRPDGTLVEKRSRLGTPASDGCIRQWITDARALWKFAPVGAKVVVLA